MFLQVSVFYCVGRGVNTSHASWEMWGQSQDMPLPPSPLWDTLPLPVTSVGDRWRPVQTCLFKDLSYFLGETSSDGN